jgi:hypothetical protein
MKQEITQENKKLVEIKSDLLQIQEQIYQKENKKSESDIKITFEITEVPKVFGTSVKILSQNFETGKSSVTFYRMSIERKIQEKMYISAQEWAELKTFVTEKKLFSAWNLWISGAVAPLKFELFN